MKIDWSTLGMALGFCVVGVVAILVLVYFTEQEYLKPSDTIQIGTLIVLVCVTFWYAISTYRIDRAASQQAIATRKQAEISRQALEVALDSEKNAVMPIIRLEKGSTTSTGEEVRRLDVRYFNIGKGPALNLRAWLTFETDDTEETQRTNILPADVVGVNESGSFLWRRGRNTVLLPDTVSDFDIIAEYSDIYKRHFCSRLSITPGQDPKFFFGMIPERTFPLI